MTWFYCSLCCDTVKKVWNTLLAWLWCLLHHNRELMYWKSTVASSVKVAAALQPKVSSHSRYCRGATFTCIDCSQTFDSRSVQVMFTSLCCFLAPTHLLTVLSELMSHRICTAGTHYLCDRKTEICGRRDQDRWLPSFRRRGRAITERF